MNALTDFGDAAVLLPVAIVLLIWLAALPKKGGTAAAWWGLSLALCIGVTALLKIYLYRCPDGSELRNPSGHVSLSVLVYGAIATILSRQVIGWPRVAVVCGTAVWVFAISASRVVIEAHTWPEVLAGFAIGGASLAVFARNYPRHASETASVRRMFVAVLMVVALLHGHTLFAEDILHRFSAYLGLAPIVCP